MKGFWIGLGLLGLLLAAGLWVIKAADDIYEPISRLLEDAAQEGLEGNIAAGSILAQQAHGMWQKHRQTIAAGANHEPMDEIESLFAQTEIYAKSQQTVAFAACCARLSELVEAMGESHRLSWWNVF